MRGGRWSDGKGLRKQVQFKGGKEVGQAEGHSQQCMCGVRNPFGAELAMRYRHCHCATAGMSESARMSRVCLNHSIMKCESGEPSSPCEQWSVWRAVLGHAIEVCCSPVSNALCQVHTSTPTSHTSMPLVLLPVLSLRCIWPPLLPLCASPTCMVWTCPTGRSLWHTDSLRTRWGGGGAVAGCVGVCVKGGRGGRAARGRGPRAAVN